MDPSNHQAKVAGRKASAHARARADISRSAAPIGALAAVVVVGMVLRAVPVLANGFPLNDGGLFLVMINAVIAGGPALPETVTYNGTVLPFAYPPLAFYLTAGFMKVTGVSGVSALEIIPVTLSVATIPVAFLLFKRLFDTQFRAVIATGAFAIIPRSYDWQVGGGGVTRALGLLAALAAIVVAIDMYRVGGRRRVWAAGALMAVTALAHPQAAVFTGTSLLLLVPFSAPSIRTGLVRFLEAGVVGAIIIAPWLVTVISRHGVRTLLGAAQTGGSIWDSLGSVASLRISDGPFEVLGVLGVFGLFVALINRCWLLPSWLVMTILVSSRAGLTYGSIMLAGGVAYGVADGIRLLRSREPSLVVGLWRQPVALGLLAVIGIAAVGDSAASGLRPLSPLNGLSADSRAAFSWIRNETAVDSVILVASGTGWFIDATSEWLPVLTGRRSSATVQGTEWLGPGVFGHREQQYIWLQSCAAEVRKDCVQQWSEVIEPVDYVLAERSSVAPELGRQCCLAFADDLERQGAPVAYRNGSVVILDVTTINAGSDGSGP